MREIGPDACMTRSRAGRRRAETRALPDWIKPQLTKLVDEPPEGSDWLHEIKFDGYRMHARVDRGAARLLTRTGLDWTHRYPAIARAVCSLRAKQAYLDGELCGIRPDGITSFSAIQAASDTGKAPSCSSFSTCFMSMATHSGRLRFGRGRSASAGCCRGRPLHCSSAIISLAVAENFTSGLADCP